MTIANRTLKSLESERYADILSDAQRRVGKNSKVIYVDSSTGASTNSGERINSPMATISQGLGKCTSGNGDTIIILPNHTETITSVVTVSKTNVTIRGLSVGNKRPTITVNGAIDLISLEAAGCAIEDLDLTIVTTDAATALINVAAAKCAIRRVKMIPSATSVNVVDCITLASGADDTVIDGTEIFNTTVAVNSFLAIEAAVARCVVRNNYWSGDVATAGIIDAATATQIRLLNNTIKTIGTNIPACILDSNPTGEGIGNYMLGTDATIANNAQWGSALILANNYTRGGTGSTVQATNIIPALDT